MKETVKQQIRRSQGIVLRIEDMVLVFLLSAIVLVVFSGVLIRYTPFTGELLWTNEVARFFFLWLIFWTAARVERAGGHYKAELVSGLFKGKAQFALQMFIKLVVLVSFGYLIWSAYGYTVQQLGVQTQELRWPAITRSLSLLFGSVLMFSYVLAGFIKNVKGLLK